MLAASLQGNEGNQVNIWSGEIHLKLLKMSRQTANYHLGECRFSNQAILVLIGSLVIVL